ncbi:hypothetical protein F4804DRAFT_278562 [Jackrogersella minutella]|nr:hypothetical protein F4804DRAFT_278562 [Jackrogersella minutella]
MYLLKAMLSLPSSLLVLLLAAASPSRAHQQHPTAIRKMSLDEGEKLFPEYYAFGPAPAPPQAMLLHHHDDEELQLSGNSSAAAPFLPPYPRHLGYQLHVGRAGEEDGSLLYRRARDALARLQGRQFACPSGTHSCTNISQPNYCCSTGTTCFVVTNAPEAGNVGCCPNGQSCGVTVGACSDDSTSCPANVGGGCCISGFVCAQVGCVASAVSIISQTTVTSTAISISSITATATTEVVTVIQTITPSGGGSPVISTTTQTTTASLGSTSSPSPTSNTGGVPAYRPTSGSSSYCPTGFYACVARAGGGCCRTGRDCSTTSCPPAAPSTTIVSDGATVVVPLSDAEAAPAATSPTCAAGWFLCGGDAGPVAGCCPSGYSCGTASCTQDTSTATATVQKALPNVAAGRRGGLADAVVVAVASLFALGLA